jgi:hypothetical protein
MTTLHSARAHADRLSALTADPAHWRALSDDENGSEHTVAEYIARLQHLYGVPFKYLVPDNVMLPPESIRFFWVDSNWIDALSDGALSLGRIGAMDKAHDAAMVSVIAQRAERSALNRRRTRLGLAPSAEPDTRPIYAGFLLRSAVVSGWPGLEVKAFKASEGTGPNTKCSGDPVDLVRMDRLSTDVLLCLFAGPFGCVNIHEPKEGINFGATLTLGAGDTATFTKDLRGLGIGGYQVGTFIEGASVEVPLRNPATRVVEVDQLRKRMIDKLRSLNPPAWTGPDESFTSAQFALEMVQGVSQHVFRAVDPPPPTPAAPRRLRRADRQAQDRETLNTFLFGPPNGDAR